MSPVGAKFGGGWLDGVKQHPSRPLTRSEDAAPGLINGLVSILDIFTLIDPFS